MATDDFNRSDSAELGADWTAITGRNNMQIVSNEVRNGVAASACGEWFNVAAGDDQYAECTILQRPAGAGEGPGPAVRISESEETLYFVMCNETNIELWISEAGSAFSLVLDAGAVAVNARVRLEAEGDALRVYEDEVLRIDTTDANIASGRVGIQGVLSSGTSGSRMDDWEGGDLTPPAPLTLPYLGLMDVDLNALALMDADLA